MDFETVKTIFLTMLMVGGMFPLLIGLLTIFHWVRPQHAPADTSNRINAIRLWWFALTREELFVDKFPWLKQDELDNVKDVK